MSISVKCEACGKTLKAPDTAAGKKAKCPSCGEVVKIPNVEVIYDAEEVSEDDADAAESDPFSGIDSYDSPALEPSDIRKPCPVCGEMIVSNAAKCRYCGEIFDPKLKKAAAKKKSKSRSSSSSYSSDDEDLTAGDWALAIICSNIGCIISIVWLIQGKPKGGKMLAASLGAQFFWFIVGTLIRVIGEANR
jgi:predicted RNA-binding Zn-ribbon protein involved in translation (DUF1610 family)